MSETEFNENKVSNVTNNSSNENDGKIKKFSRYLFPSNLFGQSKEPTLQFMDKDGNVIENESDIDGKLPDNKEKKKSRFGIFSKIFRKKTTNKNEIDSSNDDRVMVSKQNISPIKIANGIDSSDDMNLVCTPKFTFSDDDDISVINIDSDLDVYSETVNNICTDTINDNNNSVKHISINNENKYNDNNGENAINSSVPIIMNNDIHVDNNESTYINNNNDNNNNNNNNNRYNCDAINNTYMDRIDSILERRTPSIDLNKYLSTNKIPFLSEINNDSNSNSNISIEIINKSISDSENNINTNNNINNNNNNNNNNDNNIIDPINQQVMTTLW